MPKLPSSPSLRGASHVEVRSARHLAATRFVARYRGGGIRIPRLSAGRAPGLAGVARRSTRSAATRWSTSTSARAPTWSAATSRFRWSSCRRVSCENSSTPMHFQWQRPTLVALQPVPELAVLRARPTRGLSDPAAGAERRLDLVHLPAARGPGGPARPPDPGQRSQGSLRWKGDGRRRAAQEHGGSGARPASLSQHATAGRIRGRPRGARRSGRLPGEDPPTQRRDLDLAQQNRVKADQLESADAASSRPSTATRASTRKSWRA